MDTSLIEEGSATTSEAKLIGERVVTPPPYTEGLQLFALHFVCEPGSDAPRAVFEARKVRQGEDGSVQAVGDETFEVGPDDFDAFFAIVTEVREADKKRPLWAVFSERLEEWLQRASGRS
jgi:hypothetical protein